MTVQELKEQLASYPNEWEITFAGGLTFCRLKQRDSKMVNLEFNEQVYKDKQGNWHIEDLMQTASEPPPGF